MAATARHNVMDALSLPAGMDWATEFAVVDNLDDFRRKIDDFDRQIASWRAEAIANMQAGLGRIKEAVKGVPADQAWEVIAPSFAEALEAVGEALRTYSRPMHEIPEIAERVDFLSRLDAKSGRFIRKQLRRVEDVRVIQYNALTDMYYGLLAFRSEFDDQEGLSFNDGNALGEDLRKLLV